MSHTDTRDVSWKVSGESGERGLKAGVCIERPEAAAGESGTCSLEVPLQACFCSEFEDVFNPLGTQFSKL